jgi:hypothetical protein
MQLHNNLDTTTAAFGNELVCRSLKERFIAVDIGPTPARPGAHMRRARRILKGRGR